MSPITSSGTKVGIVSDHTRLVESLLPMLIPRLHTDIDKKIFLTSVGHNNDIDKKVKKEDVNLNLNAQGFAEACFGQIPKLLPPVHNCGCTRKNFEDKYDLGFIGLNLRHIRMPRDCTKEEVEKLFGPVVNKNGDCYMECTNPKILAQVERLWMITHQKP